MGACPVTALFNPFRAVADAAIGNIEAQRALAEESVRMAREDPDIDPILTLCEGLVVARMAAAHGNQGDRGRVVAMLTVAADICLHQGDDESADIFVGEALARMSLLADEGLDLAANGLNRAAEHASADAMEMAKNFERQMREVI